MGKPVKLPTPSWARDMHGETEVYTVDEVRAILAAAEQAIRADERTRVMRAYAMRHDYLGLCPDDMQPNSYDPKCKACRAIRQLGAGSKEGG